MAEIDRETLMRSLKAHTIIFIILILLTNALLIFKIVRRNLLESTFMYVTKRCTIVSLAIGDIFLALFTLIVTARSLFEDEPDMRCSTTFSSYVYGNFLINFVYGMGLVVLAIELILRLKQPISLSTTGSENSIMAFIISAIPWGLGLTIVLPLTMTGINWDTCGFDSIFSVSREKLWYGVSLIFPAILALLAGILVMFVSQSSNLTPATLSSSQILLQNSTTDVSYDSYTKYMPPLSVSAPEYELVRNPQASYPSSPPPYPGYGNSQPPNFPQEYNVYILQPPDSQLPAPTNFDKEKGTLCLICIVHFICVIPYAGYYLGYHLNEDKARLEKQAAIVLEILFYWLLFCRSVLAPLIWTCRSGD